MMRKKNPFWARMIREISNWSLKRKLISLLMFANVFLFCAASLLGIGIVAKNDDEKLRQVVASSLSKSADDIHRALRDVEAIMYRMVTDPAIQSALSETQDKSEDVIAITDAYRVIGNTLSTYITQFSEYNIHYITLDCPAFSSKSNIVWSRYLNSEDWETLDSRAEANMAGAVVSTDYLPGHALFLSQCVRRVSPLTLEPIGVVNIAINLDEIINAASVQQDGDSLYLLLDGERVIYTSPGLDLDVSEELLTMMDGSYRVLNVNGEHYFAVHTSVPELNWQYFRLVSYETTWRAQHLTIASFAVILVMCLFLSSVIGCTTVNRIMVHFDLLIAKINAFGKDSNQVLDVGVDYSNRHDEIGLLHRQFDEMANNIIDLIKTDYTNRLLMRDAQIKALESQIDPHFLYNVLETVNWRARAIGEIQISEMVSNLGKLLRTTLDRHNEDSFTLRDELQFVQNYMTIQQIRFSDQLIYTMHVPEALMDARIPKMSIQPIVENAIRYALEESLEVCEIEVSAGKQGEKLSIWIRNTGSQFPEADNCTNVEKLPSHGFGIGLANIDKRVRLTFGENYGLRFYNEDDQAVVRLDLPMPSREITGGQKC